MTTNTTSSAKAMSPELTHIEGLSGYELASREGMADQKTVSVETEVSPSLTQVEKRIRRKVDWRLLPLAGALYASSLIDRLNLSNARLAGMDKALGLSKGDRYSIITMIFFVGYILSDFPANFVMRKTGAATFLGIIGFLWGVLTIGMGFCKTWGELLFMRIIFGLLEGGLFPGLIFLLSCWYIRHEVQVRFSAFYGAGMLISGLSNMLAYGLSKADGLGGVAGWSWIFIFEGIITCVVAMLVLLFLLDFPDKAAQPSKLGIRAFLTPEEVTVILDRIERDRGDALPERFSLKTVLSALKDWKLWDCFLLLLCNMEYSIEMTYVLIFPPYVLAAIWMFITAYIGDRYMTRGPIILFNAVMTIIGVSMMGYAKGVTTRYVGVYLGLATYNASIPAIFSYQHNNIIGQTKRAVGSAVMISGGGIGGMIASNAFAQKDAPGYRPGLDTVIAVQALTVVLICKNFLIFRRQNHKADQGKLVIEGKEGFRYTL
ncbi:hypothetical protein LTR10_021215 [Elasticomyces elasticus]|uniref:Major facilitator superfamily (MFS) profile domain-containing protein n=1 Tax=Exophiala sideris TaxID=1016849 RepID=A0ABR0IY18_9EURO|nr:hypothetical protein LTR10_021215 [Elasticomyces elasticus]KAK5022341.1 hypothetical protein LTS07_010217 [Exophiala sideris]KAK5027153.1 hypothetical protein LTR13_009763 [Exophiala sideris]KAK5051728.1 hypothetical protein LTR69_010228 [Exophiala sideris]KAK5177693.1 hypothetical protein LTR44_009883 [Eurotiomycetes sp. CCFEE 6388]